MKILVISDNHGQWPLVNQIVQDLKDDMDYLFHCGDSEFTPDDPIWQDFDAVVKGNMDFTSQYPNSVLVETEVGKVYMTHGHLSNVKYGVEDLFLEGKAQGAQIILHGHSHASYALMKEEVLMVNPGSIASPRGSHPYRTYAVIEISEKTIEIKYYDPDHKWIEELTEKFIRNVGE